MQLVTVHTSGDVICAQAIPMMLPVTSSLDFRHASRPHQKLMSSAMSFRLPPATPFYSSQTNIAHPSRQRTRWTQGPNTNPLVNFREPARLLPTCTSPTLSDEEDSEVARVFSMRSSPLLTHSTPNVRRLSAPADGETPRRLTSVGRSGTPLQRRSSLSKYNPLPAIGCTSSEDASDSPEECADGGSKDDTNGAEDSDGGFKRPPRLIRSKTYTVLKVKKDKDVEEDGLQQKDLTSYVADIDNVDERDGGEQELHSGERSLES